MDYSKTRILKCMGILKRISRLKTSRLSIKTRRFTARSLKYGLLSGSILFVGLNLFLVSEESLFAPFRSSCAYSRLAAIDEFCRLIASGDIEVLRRKIRGGYDVTEKHWYGFHPLHVAVAHGNIEAVKILLENGCDVNVTDDHLIRDLLFHEDRIKTFLPNIDPNIDTEGYTPLHFAAHLGNEKMIEFLTKNGADINLKNFFGENAETILTKFHHKGYRLVKLKKVLKEESKKFKQKLMEKEREFRMKNPLEDILSEKLVGQKDPINSVASAIRRKQNGWADKDTPLVFLFLGSSGIGKTELAKQLAKYLYPNKKDSFIRVDLSEFQTKHEVSKFIGSPPGYVGHEEGGQLTKKLKENPKAVVLLDEVEKAHPDVLTVMLQLFDEGRITDGMGETINCPEAIFIMTSNLAQNEIADESLRLRRVTKSMENEFDYRFIRDKQKKNKNTFSQISAYPNSTKSFYNTVIFPTLKSHFRRDEFIGRINEILLFLPFDEKELKSLTTLELERWADIAKKRHQIELSWTPGLVDLIQQGYNVHYGARSIHHEVDRRVINRLARAHEHGLIVKGSRVVVFEKDGNVVLRFSNENK